MTTFERVLQDGAGNEVRIAITIDDGAALDRAVVHLANRARRKKSGRAKAMGGVLTVQIIEGAK